ncbi:MAG: SusD/RagB family nutrient-binding outer membrane lipoprotein, partial [Flavobacteriales bacterium]
DLLEEGINSIDGYSGLQTLDGDVLYNGNLNAWRSLAQSLRIKYLMRISSQVDVSSDLQAIYDSGDYITSNAGNAVFQFSDGQPNNFRMANLREGDFNLFVMSETMQEVLERYDDPRKEVFFRPIGADSTQTEYVGLLNGPDASSTSISVSDYSRAGTAFRENTGVLQANLMTAWETNFFLAEAAQIGMIAAPAQQLYEDGVSMAFDYWNTALPADYLSSGNAAYGQNGADPIEQIVTQKWLANTINGYEGWIEYRRTGFPEFKTVSASLNGDLIPVKMPYPADEVALNNQNFVNATGGDNNINAPVWWDAE